MVVFVIGGGRVGSFLARVFKEEGHEVVVVEKEKEVCEGIEKSEGLKVYRADACDPMQLEESGIRRAEVAVVVTGHDEDNLVIAQLAKHYFHVPRVVARVNNPKNKWLYTREWGVDVAVSQTHIIADILKEEASLGDLVTLLRFKGGEVALVEVEVEADSPLRGKAVKDLELPPSSLIVGVVRGEEVILPHGSTTFEQNDQIIALTRVKYEKDLAAALGALD